MPYCVTECFGGELEEVERLEQELLDQRRAIRNGYVTLIFNGRYGKGPMSGKHEVWFDIDSGQSRFDRWDAETGVTEVRCLGCEGNKDNHISYSDEVLANGMRRPVTVQSASALEHERYPAPYVPILGLSPTDAIGTFRYDIDSLSKLWRSGSARLETSEFDGIACWLIVRESEERVDGKTVAKTVRRTWVTKDKKKQVLKVSVEAARGTLVGVSRIICENQYHDSIGSYFPKKIQYKSIVDNKIMREETLDIEVHSFNTPLPSDAFRLSGINAIREDTLISVNPNASFKPEVSKPYIWDGKKIRKGQDSDFLQEPESGRRHGGWLRPMLIIGNIVILIGIGVWWKLRSHA